ncbi:Shedu anti-phage system protein SduA domain-containing protein [Pseudomonas sp. SG20052]|uniref:Shedu anti-phage system protein SduA domain-containing protein n=1 Tax=Pseudomonas sp. SG20052 TaxID=3074147 RepID=UPI00287FE0A0|nr:Shedu anti-phage system protein SduA domain-containing protein [Pseudomonas sp. SG20052]WNF58078.1 DUF4263 domain-containing protein [Pseudomonas sp. SG20052]
MGCAFNGFEEELEKTRQSVRKKVEAQNAKRKAKKSNSREKVSIFHVRSKPSSNNKSAKFKRERENFHDENRLHRYLIKNPHLIFTPRLFLGGLYLNSIISKRQLSSEHIPDFCYITCQANIIKVTLVEIESSARKVFTRKKGKDCLHSDINGPLRQVNEWKSELTFPAERQASLLKLKRLFEQYPYKIFDDNGVKNNVFLRFDYLLVIGDKAPESDAQQQLLDNILHEQNILVMTYSMMIREARKSSQRNNMLRLNHGGVIADTLQNGQRLVHKVATLTSDASEVRSLICELKQLPDTDPHGLEMIGPGAIFKRIGYHYTLYNPFGFPDVQHMIFQRAGGRCEIPGCGLPIMNSPEDIGFYVRRGPQQFKASNGQAVVMVCASHLRGPSLQEQLQGWSAGANSNDSVPYRADHEREWHLFNRINVSIQLDKLSKSLGFNQSHSPMEHANLRNWLLRLRSLPEGHAHFLRQVLLARLDYFHHPIQLFENVSEVQQHPVTGDLYRLGLISPEKYNEGLFILLPVLPSDNFLAYITDRYGDDLRRVITRLFEWDAAGLTIDNE